ncbi:DUF1189 family protein [Macrococcus animalis]|uniref:DUF1189 family protein n=1 Tax=Macrococcus animalis TaxID=3395467 RepID=UPI0039BEC901
MYIKHLKRIFKPTQYPLFRTIKLRYIFMHLLFIAILFSITNSLNYYNIIQVANQMVEKKQDEIPAFQINNNRLILSEEKSIKVDSYTIQFKKENQIPKQQVMTFQKEGIQIDESTFLPYMNLPVFEDKASLIKFLKTYTASSYFYLSLIIGFLIFIQFITTIIKIIFLSTIAHLLAIVLHKKSRFMNWLKINTFLITIPSIILFLGLLINPIAPFLIVFSWALIAILIVITINKLPKNKLKSQ